MTMLDVADLHTGYGSVRVLHGVSFRIDAGCTAVILGSNGAGKTTILKALTGLTRNKGRILLDGEDITRAQTERIVRKGVAHVPQGRGTFTDETVENNLRAAAYVRNDDGVRTDIELCYEMFPRLGERRRQIAGGLSGGEQQMLAIARALMLRPRLLLLDEPSLGLAPIVVKGVFLALAKLKSELAVTMLIVEQNASLALDLANYAYVLEAGTIVFEGKAEEVRSSASLRRSYLGY